MSESTRELIKTLGASSLSGVFFAIGSSLAGVFLSEVLNRLEREEDPRHIRGFARGDDECPVA